MNNFLKITYSICLIFFQISCIKKEIEVVSPASSKNELIELTFSDPSFDYKAIINDLKIDLIVNLPIKLTKIKIKSIKISEKASSNFVLNDEINLDNNSVEFIITAENGDKKIYSFLPKFATEPFKVIKYDSKEISKQNITPTFIHYMPWFESPEFAEFGNSKFGKWGQHWTMNTQNPEIKDGNGKRQIASHYYPLIGPYDNGEPNYCEYASILIKLSGIDGVIIDYPGITTVYDWKLLHEHTLAFIPWLQKAGLKYSICYEDAALKNAFEKAIITDKIEEGKRVMKYMDDTFFNNPEYFKLNNKPVLLNFGPQAIKSDQDWQDIFSVTSKGVMFFPLAYHGDYFNLSKSAEGAFAWVDETIDNKFYNYSSKLKFTGGGAMFEFRDFYKIGGWGDGYTTYPNKNGDLLIASLKRAKDAKVDFLQLITWNDWGEGTAMEPSNEYNYLQLSTVQKYLGVTQNENDLALAVKLYQNRKKYKGKEIENKILDQAYYYLISLQTDKARELLNSL
jgi:hypothetical protein